MSKRSEAIASGDLDEALYEITSEAKALGEILWAFKEYNLGARDPEVWEGVLSFVRHHADQLDDVRSAVGIKQTLLDEYGDKIEELTAKATPSTPRAVQLREEFIAAKASEGADPGDIASAMNMKRTSIERVIRALQGAGAVPLAAAANG